MQWKKSEFWLAIGLIIYLLIVGLGGAAAIIVNFPTTTPGANGALVLEFPKSPAGILRFLYFSDGPTSDQGLILLAFMAGMSGSFLHAAQSLSSYVGNNDFKSSWASWYFLRPWIGGILGIVIYFAFRAGLVGGASTVNPHGVVAFGLLGGWFSKATTDKLQEVFKVLFKTDEDEKRKDKLRANDRPIVDSFEPASVPPGGNEIFIVGRNFLRGATVLIAGEELPADWVSETRLKVPLDNLSNRPASGTEVPVGVKNPEGLEPSSEERKLKFD